MTGIKSICAFIGSSDYALSRRFYAEIGFEESEVSPKMCYFRNGAFGFYLQDYYVKEWVENSMVFLEVEDPEHWLSELKGFSLPEKYKGCRLSEMQYNDWGEEFFLHDPMEVLWHIGRFKE